MGMTQGPSGFLSHHQRAKSSKHLELREHDLVEAMPTDLVSGHMVKRSLSRARFRNKLSSSHMTAARTPSAMVEEGSNRSSWSKMSGPQKSSWILMFESDTNFQCWNQHGSGQWIESAPPLCPLPRSGCRTCQWFHESLRWFHGN